MMDVILSADLARSLTVASSRRELGGREAVSHDAGTRQGCHEAGFR
jgi:hypothetical protein